MFGSCSSTLPNDVVPQEPHQHQWQGPSRERVHHVSNLSETNPCQVVSTLCQWAQFGTGYQGSDQALSSSLATFLVPKVPAPRLLLSYTSKHGYEDSSTFVAVFLLPSDVSIITSETHQTRAVLQSALRASRRTPVPARRASAPDQSRRRPIGVRWRSRGCLRLRISGGLAL